jgi:ribonuclease HII
LQKVELEMTTKIDPTLEFENSLWQQGYSSLARIDEVGRGCLAGPVVDGAAILPARFAIETLHGVRDSKQMTETQRERMNTIIQKVSVSVGIGEASSDEIDEKGIPAATKLAMMRAVAALSPAPDYFLVDAVKLTALIAPPLFTATP